MTIWFYAWNFDSTHDNWAEKFYTFFHLLPSICGAWHSKRYRWTASCTSCAIGSISGISHCIPCRAHAARVGPRADAVDNLHHVTGQPIPLSQHELPTVGLLRWFTNLRHIQTHETSSASPTHGNVFSICPEVDVPYSSEIEWQEDRNAAYLRHQWALLISEHQVTPATVVQNIGVIMDTHASMEAHVNNVSHAAYYYLYNIGRIRCYLSQSAAEQLVHAFITSKLDYCNALLCGLPSLLTQKLQRIQNAAARIVTRTSRSAHITPVLFALHWLPACQRIKCKVLVIAFKAGLPPGTYPAVSSRSWTTFSQSPLAQCSIHLNRRWLATEPSE